MRRLLVTVLLLAAPICLVSFLGLWWLSFHKLTYWSGDADTSVHLTQGSLILGYWLDDDPARPLGWMMRGYSGLRTLYWLPHIGSERFHVRIPLWLPSVTLLLACTPAMVLLRRRMIEHDALRRGGLGLSLGAALATAGLWLVSGLWHPCWINDLQTRRVLLERGRVVFSAGTLLSAPARTAAPFTMNVQTLRLPVPAPQLSAEASKVGQLLEDSGLMRLLDDCLEDSSGARALSSASAAQILEAIKGIGPGTSNSRGSARTRNYAWTGPGPALALAGSQPPWFSWPGVGARGTDVDVRVPLWIFLTLTLAASAFFYTPVYGIRRRRRLGLCIKCSYDLRGSGQRCPECGHVDLTRSETG